MTEQKGFEEIEKVLKSIAEGSVNPDWVKTTFGDDTLTKLARNMIVLGVLTKVVSTLTGFSWYTDTLVHFVYQFIRMMPEELREEVNNTTEGRFVKLFDLLREAKVLSIE